MRFRGARVVSLAWAAAVLVAPLHVDAACPPAGLEVDPAGGAGAYATLQAAVDDFASTYGNLGPCQIRVAPGDYTASTALDGINAGATSAEERLEIVAAPGVSLNTGRAFAVRFKGSRHVTLRGTTDPTGPAPITSQVLTGTNRPIDVDVGNIGITIEGWSLHDNGGGRDSGCIYVDSGNSDIWIANNICWMNGSNAIVLSAGGPHYVVNNTVYRNDKSGILVARGAEAIIANNLVLFNGAGGGAQYGIDLRTNGGGPASVVSLLHNIVYGNDPGSGGDIANADAATVSTGNLTTGDLPALTAEDFFEDPDPAVANFRQALGSPSIGAGTSSTGTTPERVPETDFEGDPRTPPVDVGFDQGADLDEDGVTDRSDNCPPLSSTEGNATYNPDQADNDGDGIGNICDNCPDDANPDQADANLSGGQPDGLGDACQALLELGGGPPGGLTGTDLFVTPTLLVGPDPVTAARPLDPTLTTFVCLDLGTGEALVRRQLDPASLGPFDFTTLAPGSSTSFLADLDERFAPGSFQPGVSYECFNCYSNDVDPVSLDAFTGIVCSEPYVFTVGDSTGVGCSPGYWRNHPERWPETGYAASDDFDSTFGVDLFTPDITLGDAVSLGGGDENALARHATAALLSAAHPDVSYPLTVDQILVLVQTGDPTATQQLLADFNNQSCPLSGGNP